MGRRAIGYVQDGTTRLMSRNDLDVSVSYAEVLKPPAPVRRRGLVLDGELVALDEQGRPSFGRLQERMHVRDPTAVRRLAGRGRHTTDQSRCRESTSVEPGPTGDRCATAAPPRRLDT